jgi:hypothetical protein
MGFSLPNFLRRTPPTALENYFAACGFSPVSGINWESKPQLLLERLLEAINSLPNQNREHVFDDFERATQLCDEIGQRALQSVLAHDLLEAVRASDSHEARSLLVLLRNPHAFDHALATAYADRFRNGRSWSGFLLSSRIVSQPDQAGLIALEAEVGRLFKAFDGSGRKLKIEYFERRGQWFKGKAASPIMHYSIYVEGLPESGIEFEGDHDEPTRRTRRPVVEAAICYEPEGGQIDIVSKGGRPVREEIARSFAACVLCSTSALEPVSRRQFSLNRLKGRMPFPRDQHDGIKDVRVTLLRLADIADGSERLTIEKDDPVGGDIYDASTRWFGDADPLKRANWRVTQAKLCIVFHPEQTGKREKKIVIDLRAPNGSNLKDQTRRHQLVSEKYLERWGLVECAWRVTFDGI